jgi:hypothetical protein
LMCRLSECSKSATLRFSWHYPTWFKFGWDLTAFDSCNLRSCYLTLALMHVSSEYLLFMVRNALEWCETHFDGAPMGL